MELEGRIAVITGGGSGLGAAMARRFGTEGMRVVVADIAAENAETVAAELRGAGTDAIAHAVDVGDAASLAELADAAKAFGGCQLLCANVGVQRIGHSDRLDAQDWEWLIGVNVLGTVATVGALLPVMRSAAGRKHIVFTSSSSGLFAAPRLAAYTASKYAVTGYAETLRIELEPDEIGVTLLFPGGMATTHLQSSVEARPAALGESPPLEVDDVKLLSAVMGATADDIIEPDHAIRHLIEAVRENRPYLFTHGSNRAQIEERFDALRAALAAADD